MTRKIIAMIGEPAVGKSSIMRRFIGSIAPWSEREDVKLVPTLYNKGCNLHVLGSYPEGEPFGGTDRYSMAVQPQAVKFVEQTDANILFEGDRLGNQSFLEFLAEQSNTDFKLMVITASQDEIDTRHVQRADSQSDVFKRGRKTKIDNLRSNMVLMGYTETWVNETLADQSKIVQYLLDQLVRG